MRSLQKNLRLHQGQGLRFPCNDQTDEVNKLFITWPFHYGPEPAVNKTSNWSADNLKKTMSCTIEAAIQSDDTGQRMSFLTAVN